MKKRLIECSWLALLGAGVVGVGMSLGTVNTTVNDFFQGGSQPQTLVQKLTSANVCLACHAEYSAIHEPFRNWAASMMGQSARDPVFRAAMTIANQDAANAGEFCLRCHAAVGWIAGRSDPADGSAMAGADFEGVSCSVCHRMLNPVYHPGQSPAIDQTILANLPHHPVNPGNGSYIFDPYDRRRGPFVLDVEPHAWLHSPFHQDSGLCATCHEVSNPIWDKQADGTYRLNALDAPHPTGNKYHMFPEQRTYSEWAMSAFAAGPIEMGGRFGGNLTAVSSCQDCHMPDLSGVGCDPVFGPTFRNNLPAHFLNGANTWVLRAVRSLYPDSETHLSAESVQESIDRTHGMLAAASDVSLTATATRLTVRVTNQTGHKLPTGYPEGRRMWVNVRFLGDGGQLIAERGAYDTLTAELTTDDTKVYEAVLGLDAYAAGQFNRSPGPSAHFVLANTIVKDNRIPPRGFTNANFATIQSLPVGATYADGQYWDDTTYAIPSGASRAEVRVYYQTSSKEYMEFLRDANTTNNDGQIAYDQWVLHGKSAPALMDFATIELNTCVADFDDGTGTGTRDGGVTIEDLLYYLSLYEAGDPACDIDDGSFTGTPDGGATIDDLLYYLARYEAGC